MKIIREGSYINHINSITKANLSASANLTAKAGRKNFDAITISSREAPDEMTFAKEIAKKISKEVSSSSDPQKVDELKAQVQSGSYQIMIDEIAKKMLLS